MEAELPKIRTLIENGDSTWLFKSVTYFLVVPNK